MSGNPPTKTLALLIEDNVITYLTRSNQGEELFYSEPVRFEYNSNLKNSTKDQIFTDIKSQLPLHLFYNRIKIFYTTPDIKIIPNAYLCRSNDINLEEKLIETSDIPNTWKLDLFIKSDNEKVEITYNDEREIIKSLSNGKKITSYSFHFKWIHYSTLPCQLTKLFLH